MVQVQGPNIGSKKLVCMDQRTWEEEKQGLLETVFLDGKLVKHQSLSEIRERLNNYSYVYDSQK